MRHIVATTLALSLIGTSAAMAASSVETLSSAGVDAKVSKDTNGVSTITYKFEGVAEAPLAAGSNRTVMVLPADKEVTDTADLIYVKQIDGSQETSLANTFTEMKTSIAMPAGVSYKVCFGDANSATMWDQFKFHLLTDKLTVSNVRKGYKTVEDKTTYQFSVRVAGEEAKDAVIHLATKDAGKVNAISDYKYSFSNANLPVLDGVYLQGAVKFEANGAFDNKYTAILSKALESGENAYVDLATDTIGKLHLAKKTAVVNDIDVEDNLLVFDVVDEDGNVVDVYDSSAEIQDEFFGENAPEEVTPDVETSTDDEFVEEEFTEEEF